MGEVNSKILLIEDEEIVRLGIEETLKHEGYKVFAYENGVAGLEGFKTEQPDLVVLDIMVPELDGLEVCRQIRTAGRLTPIIMLTAKCSEVDKVVGLELGADDYLTKPFGMRELIARIKALLRRSRTVTAGEETSLTKIDFSGVNIDFKGYRARRGEEEIILSAKEFELLKYLVNNINVPVSRDELLDQVWGYNHYPTTRTVDNFIARLRHKLEPLPEKPQHILTVHGVGYKFVQDLSQNG